jgi:hypothetical protein
MSMVIDSVGTGSVNHAARPNPNVTSTDVYKTTYHMLRKLESARLLAPLPLTAECDLRLSYTNSVHARALDMYTPYVCTDTPDDYEPPGFRPAPAHTPWLDQNIPVSSNIVDAAVATRHLGSTIH